MSFIDQDEINGQHRKQSLTPRIVPNLPNINLPNSRFQASSKGQTKEQRLTVKIADFDEKIKAFHAYYYE